MKQTTKICEKVNPDFIDINYGCPVKKVTCKGAGSGILKDIPKMVSMTKEIVNSTHLPVTVKTRLGWDDNSKHIVEIAERLQDVGIKAIAIHGRTRKQMYKGEADWSLIADVKNNPHMHIPVFGNGDVDSPQTAQLKRDKYGVDGIMIGRAAIGYPWIFNEIKHFLKTGQEPPKPTMKERIEVCKEHLEFSLKWKGPILGVVETRRHYTNYFKHIPNFKEYRMRLVTAQQPEELFEILSEIEHTFGEYEFA